MGRSSDIAFLLGASWDDEERLVYDNDDFWLSEVTHFFDSIVEDTPVAIGNSDDAVRLMRMMDKIYENK